MRGLVCTGAVLAVTTRVVWASRPQNSTSAYVASVEIIKRYPHDATGFTQGLCADADGRVYESDGLYGHSRVRRVELTTGASSQEKKNNHNHFGEGLTVIPTKDAPLLLQLTWRERVMIEYSLDLEELRRVEQPLPREGWGVAYDAARDLVHVTDGSAKLRSFRRTDSGDYVLQHETTVVDANLDDLAVDGLNELEMVGDELWANVFPMHHHSASNCVCRIDPDTGDVRGWIDANALFKSESAKVQKHHLHYVLNGIVELPGGTVLMTGKQWDHVYEVDFVAKPKLGPDHVRKNCDLYFPGVIKRKRPLPT